MGYGCGGGLSWVEVLSTCHGCDGRLSWVVVDFGGSHCGLPWIWFWLGLWLLANLDHVDTPFCNPHLTSHEGKSVISHWKQAS